MATKQSMSITQALAELKLLDKRISKVTYNYEDSMKWVMVSTKAQPIDAEKLRKTAEAEYQSYMDLCKRRDSIKRAIVLSNAVTKVKIGQWEGTLAEAIEQKASIRYKNELLTLMRSMMNTAKTSMEEQQRQADQRLERLLASELGKDVRTNPETIATLTASFQEGNKITLVDPLNLNSKIKALEEEIESFETNVDWVLSEANGRTMIEV